MPQAKLEPPEPRPVFMVNPSIIIAINDDMARELVGYLRRASADGKAPLPKPIYTFMRRIEIDLRSY